MDWQLQLITVYVRVCDSWEKGIFETVQRFSNNNRFKLTDQEVATLYLFGVISGFKNVRTVYDYANRPETFSMWVSSPRQPIESFFNWLGKNRYSVRFESTFRC